MSIFSSAMDLVSDVAKLIPGGGVVASAVDLFSSVMDKVMPMVSDMVQASPLNDDAKSMFSKAYDAGFGG